MAKCKMKIHTVFKLPAWSQIIITLRYNCKPDDKVLLENIACKIITVRHDFTSYKETIMNANTRDCQAALHPR